MRLIEKGGAVVQETRLWDEAAGRSESMRSKESAHDYRYFPEPDLPPFRPDDEFLSRVDAAMIELPQARRRRFTNELGVKQVQAGLLTEERESADFFEAVCAAGPDPVTAAAWLCGDVDKHLKRRGLTIETSCLTPLRLAELIGLVDQQTISRPAAREVLEGVLDEDRDPRELVAERGLEQEDNAAELKELILKISVENPQATEQIRQGDLKPVGFFVGQVLRAAGGKADPKSVQTLIRDHFGL